MVHLRPRGGRAHQRPPPGSARGGATAFRQWGQTFVIIGIVHCVLAEFQWGQ